MGGKMRKCFCAECDPVKLIEEGGSNSNRRSCANRRSGNTSGGGGNAAGGKGGTDANGVLAEEKQEERRNDDEHLLSNWGGSSDRNGYHREAVSSLSNRATLSDELSPPSSASPVSDPVVSTTLEAPLSMTSEQQ